MVCLPKVLWHCHSTFFCIIFHKKQKSVYAVKEFLLSLSRQKKITQTKNVRTLFKTDIV